MEARRQELLSEEDGYWRQRMDQQQLVEKLKAEVAEQEEHKGHSEVKLCSSYVVICKLHGCLLYGSAWPDESQQLFLASLSLALMCCKPSKHNSFASQLFSGSMCGTPVP